MVDIVPPDPGVRRTAFILWAIGALVGTVAVWWLSRYLESLTTLAYTDRDAALALFRSRVLPALAAIVLVAIGAGAWLARFGILVLRHEEFPPRGTRLLAPTPRRTGRPARMIGMLFAIAGLLVIACPLTMLGVILWVLR